MSSGSVGRPRAAVRITGAALASTRRTARLRPRARSLRRWWRRGAARSGCPARVGAPPAAGAQEQMREGPLGKDLLFDLGAVPPAHLLLGFIHGVHLNRWWTPSLPLRPIPSRVG